MSTGLAGALRVQLRRDMQVAGAHWGELANPLVFFLAVTAMFPLALSPSEQLLARLAPGVVWVAALLAALLSQDSMFRADHEDGSLEQLALSPQPLTVLVLARLVSHWLVTGLPLVLLSPAAALSLSLPVDGLVTMMAALTLATPVLTILGGIGAALTVGLNRGGLLLSILVLPLLVPPLIFGARATDLAAHGESAGGVLYLLGAILVLALSLGPFAIAAAIRISLD